MLVLFVDPGAPAPVATFTLTGNMGELLGSSATRTAYVQTDSRIVNTTGSIVFEGADSTKVTNGMLSFRLPANDPTNLPHATTGPQFAFKVTVGKQSWDVPAQATDSTHDLAEFTTPWAAPPTTGDASTIDAINATLLGTPDSSTSTAVRALQAATFVGIPLMADAATAFVTPNGNDAKDGLTAKTAKKTVAAAYAALPSAGGRIQLGYGTVAESATLDIDKPVRIEGCGPFIGAPSPSAIQFPAGVSGIRVNAGGQTSRLEGFRLTSLSTTAGTDDGLLIRGHGTSIDQLHIEKFGRDGLVFDTTASGNANSCTVGYVRIVNNKRHGLYMAGVDANLIVFTKLECVLNGGWGVYINQPQVYGTIMMAPNIDRNTLGGVHDEGTGTFWINPDVEPGPPGYTVELIGPGITWWGDSRTDPAITFTSSQRVFWGGIPVSRNRVLAADHGKSFSWTSGVYESTSLALTDDANNVNVLDYRPTTKRFRHLTPLHASQGFYQKANTITPASGAVTFDVTTGNLFVVPLTGNVTSAALGVANVTDAPVVTVTWAQDATGGRTYVWPTNCRFAGGNAPSDTTANTSTSATFRLDAAVNRWYEVSRAVAVPV